MSCRDRLVLRPVHDHLEQLPYRPSHPAHVQAGGFLSSAAGWKWVAALLAFFALLLAVLGTLFQPETYEPVLLRRRAAWLSKLTGKVYRSERDAAKPLDPVKLFLDGLKTPWVLLFTETVAFLMAI